MPSTRETDAALDKLAMRYLAALDAGDFDAIGQIWTAAETDAALADMLHDLNTEYTRQAAGEADAEAGAMRRAEAEQAAADLARGPDPFDPDFPF
jgi:hypothetical protein